MLNELSVTKRKKVLYDSTYMSYFSSVQSLSRRTVKIIEIERKGNGAFLTGREFWFYKMSPVGKLAAPTTRQEGFLP